MTSEISVGDVVGLTRDMEGLKKGQRCLVAEMMRGGYIYISAEGTDTGTESFSVHLSDVDLLEKATV